MLTARRKIVNVLHAVILLLSVAMIVYISYDTFRNIPFLTDRGYMTFQFFVCMIFMADFFVELKLTPKGERRHYVGARWFFLLLSVPVLNIVGLFHLQLSADFLYFARFLPLARGALALAIVLNYIASTRITGFFVSYVSIMVLTVYFAGLIFYEREHPVNPGVENYWDAFGWCALQTTTMGSALNPVTVAGKLLAVVLSLMGVVMFPLFTVYLTSLIKRSRDKLNKFNISENSLKSEPATANPPAAGAPEVAATEKNA